MGLQLSIDILEIQLGYHYLLILICASLKKSIIVIVGDLLIFLLLVVLDHSATDTGHIPYSMRIFYLFFFIFTFGAYIIVRRIFLTKYSGQRSQRNPVYPE